MPRAVVEVAAKISKEDALALLSACYEQKLQQMENEIRSLRDDKQSLLQVAARRELLPAIHSIPKFMSVPELAEYHAISNKEALRARLYRFREKHKFDAEAFREVTNKGIRQPQFLYNVAMVDPLVRSLKKKETSSKRPSAKK